VHRTPVLHSQSLDEWIGAEVFVKGEHLQRIGAFKYRGATNAVQSLSDTEARNGVAAHSSGNHAAALALAAATRGIPAYVVMPKSVAVKKAAVLPTAPRSRTARPRPSRAATLAEVVARTGASRCTR
jgi:threonine dehydratase